ncbi:methyltransferase domain-containing protein [Candidatus Bathyarchaeota archaeon]|nr:methyltransferase domain-containing protein [Candidatus Bathyarchaeota archaeon]
MKQESSYKIQNFAANIDNEIRRLKAQVELFWDKELRFLRMFGLHDGMRILECGCGPGYVIEKLLQSNPSSHITGLEIDPFLVQKSKELLASLKNSRGHIVEQSIMQMDFEDNSFDFVISRLLLEHLSDPLNAVKEVYRVLKTGGKVVFIDNDFDMHLRAYPDIPELNDLYEAYCRCRIAEGGNPRIGRQLPNLLQAGGFSNIDLEVVSAHSLVIGDEAFLRSEGSSIPMQLVKDGYLSREVLDSLTRKWHDVVQQKQHVFFRQLFVSVGEKLPSHDAQSKSEPQEMDQSKQSPVVHEILNSSSPHKSFPLLTAYLQVQMATSLKTEQESIQVDRPFIELGVDSIMSVELSNRIETDFGITISAVDILEAQSISAIAKRLNFEIVKQKQAGTSSTPAYEEQMTKSEGESQRNEKTGSELNDKDWEDGEL